MRQGPAVIVTAGFLYVFVWAKPAQKAPTTAAGADRFSMYLRHRLTGNTSCVTVKTA